MVDSFFYPDTVYAHKMETGKTNEITGKAKTLNTIPVQPLFANK